jgi:hypothetical protein
MGEHWNAGIAVTADIAENGALFPGWTLCVD